MDPEIVLEPERCELFEPPRYRFEVDRRSFLKIFSAMGGGLLVVARAPEALAQEAGRAAQGRAGAGDLASWIHVDERGRVTVFTGKVEIGQNIRTSLAQVVAEEIGAPISSVSLVMADTDLTPFDQGTFGSRTTPTMAPVLARAAATAREMLIDRAAATWKIDRAGLSAKNGAVVSGDGRSIGFGEITRGQQLAGAVPANAPIAPASAWTLRGTPVKKVDGRQFVTGAHEYTPDVTRPNLRIGRVVRPPAFGATPVSVDDARVRAIGNVAVVRDGDFIGVVAPNERVAKRAAETLDVKWSAAPAQPDSTTIYDYLKSTPAQGGGGGGRGGGAANAGAANVARARAGASKTFDARYEIPYIAHVPLEPRAAVAEWTGDKLTVWTGTQRPFGVRTALAGAFRIPEDRVRVIVPDMGSGYGGKHTGEHAIEAARLAKAAGAPVKVVYTRAEEFSWGYFRPAGVIEIRAGVDASSKLSFWEFDNWNSGSSGLNTPYTIGAKREQFHASETPLRQGSYRGLAATANHYAREMHMDAIARALKIDPVQFRLDHLSDVRLRAVLTTVARTSGWPKASQPGRALGIACGTEKGSCIATAAEISRTPDGFKLEKVWAVFECGAILNPNGLHNQTEGAIVQGLGGALFEAIRFADGRILNGTMAEYRVPRFKDVPPIEVTLLDRKDLPSAGAGETPIVCIAPAIGSALRNFGEVAEALPVALRANRTS